MSSLYNIQNTTFLQIRNHIAVSFFAFLSVVWTSNNISNSMHQKKAVFKEDNETMARGRWSFRLHNKNFGRTRFI